MRKKKTRTIVELKIDTLDMMIKNAKHLDGLFIEWLKGDITDKTFAYTFGVEIESIIKLTEMLKKRAVKEEEK